MQNNRWFPKFFFYSQIKVIDTALLTNRELAKSGYSFFDEYLSKTLPDVIENCGIDDFLYSVSIVPSKFERLAKCLSEDCEITVLVDSVYIAEKLVKFFNQTGFKIKAVIELD